MVTNKIVTMRPKTKLPEGTLTRMLELSKRATNAAELRRIQCIIFRVRDDMDALQIAQTVGLHASTVRNIHSAFLREGDAALKLKPKGGRYHENLPVKEEKAFLIPFLKAAEQGGILEIGPIKRVYEKKLGRKVPASTIYRLLHRHGWRKIVPRPTHPKSDKQTMECFKKNSRSLSKRPIKKRKQKG